MQLHNGNCRLLLSQWFVGISVPVLTQKGLLNLPFSSKIKYKSSIRVTRTGINGEGASGVHGNILDRVAEACRMERRNLLMLVSSFLQLCIARGYRHGGDCVGMLHLEEIPRQNGRSTRLGYCDNSAGCPRSPRPAVEACESGQYVLSLEHLLSIVAPIAASLARVRLHALEVRPGTSSEGSF